MSNDPWTKMDKDDIFELALSMYANEPCRICGELITMQQLKSHGVIFAGYSQNDKSRSAHKSCWDKRDTTEWAYK